MLRQHWWTLPTSLVPFFKNGLVFISLTVCYCYHCVNGVWNGVALPQTSQFAHLCFCQTSAWTLSSFLWMWGLLDPNKKKKKRKQGSVEVKIRLFIQCTEPYPRTYDACSFPGHFQLPEEVLQLLPFDVAIPWKGRQITPSQHTTKGPVFSIADNAETPPAKMWLRCQTDPRTAPFDHRF